LDDEGLLNGTHPPPAIRSHFCRNIAIQIARGRGSDDQGATLIAQMAVKSTLDAARIWESITGIRESTRLLYFDDNSVQDGMDRVLKYMHKLLDCWHEIRPSLLESSLVPLVLSKYEDRS
jgi:hypothetical protein